MAVIITKKTRILEKEPFHEVNSIYQWHKLSMALQMIREEEYKMKKRYTHILKLRTDYHHANPENILKDLVRSEGIICASDKVFGGSRDLMLMFEGFYGAIDGFFENKEKEYWPINIDQILNSDESSKWYGMLFPKEIVGEPKTVDALRSFIQQNRLGIKYKLQKWGKINTDYRESSFCQLFRGHDKFASEICFAKFLNFNSIKANSCPGLLGFLRSDRLQP